MPEHTAQAEPLEQVMLMTTCHSTSRALPTGVETLPQGQGDETRSLANCTDPSPLKTRKSSRLSQPFKFPHKPNNESLNTKNLYTSNKQLQLTLHVHKSKELSRHIKLY